MKPHDCDIILCMKTRLKKYEVLVEHIEVSRIIVEAESMMSAQDFALENECKGDVASSTSISSRCIGCQELRGAL